MNLNIALLYIIALAIFTMIIILLLTKRNNKKERLKLSVDIYKSSNRHRYNARDYRLKRHNRIRTVLSFITTYNHLMESSNFYELKNNKSNYEQAKVWMRKEHIEILDIETAIRYCQIEHFYGICKRRLLDSEIKLLYKWREITIDEDKLYTKVVQSYEVYWNKVLNEYKRPSAKKNRLNYLINDLEEIMQIPDIHNRPNILKKIKRLQNEYAAEVYRMT